MELEFKDFFSGLTADEKKELAEKAGTSVAYLSQLANGHRKAGLASVTQLTQADKRITHAMLRPDVSGNAQAA